MLAREASVTIGASSAWHRVWTAPPAEPAVTSDGCLVAGSETSDPSLSQARLSGSLSSPSEWPCGAVLAPEGAPAAEWWVTLLGYPADGCRWMVPST